MNMQKSIYANLNNEPTELNRPKAFLQASLALGLICTLQGYERQHTARWNRTRAAEEAILRVCDIYLPDGMDKARLTSIMDVLDGPIEQTFERNWPVLMDAVQGLEP